RDSNSRRPPWQGGALPLSYTRNFACQPQLLAKGLERGNNNVQRPAWRNLLIASPGLKLLNPDRALSANGRHRNGGPRHRDHSIPFCRCGVESKRGRIRSVKYWQTALAILGVLAVSIALGDDFKTINGKEYKNVTVSRVEPDGIMVASKSGILKLYFVELPKEVQERFNYNSEKAAAYSAAQDAALQQARKQQEEAGRKEKEAIARAQKEAGQKEAIV